jgi:hypothetical protein
MRFSNQPLKDVSIKRTIRTNPTQYPIIEAKNQRFFFSGTTLVITEIRVSAGINMTKLSTRQRKKKKIFTQA